MTRETITGVLHVILTRKSRIGPGRGSFDRLFAQLVEQAAEEIGKLPTLYYPPTYFILTDQTIGDRRRLRGDDRDWRLDDHFQFRFKGRPKALAPELRGHVVTVRAGVDTFGNGLGGYLIRPDVQHVGDYVECPHHDDPPDDPAKGTARIYCTAAIADERRPLHNTAP